MSYLHTDHIIRDSLIASGLTVSWALWVYATLKDTDKCAS